MIEWTGEAEGAVLSMGVLSTAKKRPSCSVTTLLQKWQRGIKEGRNDVPCGDCNACCRSPKIRVTIGDEEAKARGLETFVDDGGQWLAKKTDGSCLYLTDGKCSIYANRPGACRTYDCRASGLLIGWSDLNDPIIQEALTEWEPLKTPLPEDRDTLLAIRMAVLDQGVPQSFAEAYRKFPRWPQFLEKARKAWPLCELVLCRVVAVKGTDDGEAVERIPCMVLVAKDEATIMLAVRAPEQPNTMVGIELKNVRRVVENVTPSPPA